MRLRNRPSSLLALVAAAAHVQTTSLVLFYGGRRALEKRGHDPTNSGRGIRPFIDPPLNRAVFSTCCAKSCWDTKTRECEDISTSPCHHNQERSTECTSSQPVDVRALKQNTHLYQDLDSVPVTCLSPFPQVCNCLL
ncbi:rCG35281 [Rattus norvegicus]|uniref:RCG35281 n=1 Tax=Rattus norvegicus TaxID=10116 RepID=A6HGE5_RAT|nr:rCG35281 [Rattus norvegicus]